jgi:hypothetical protein
MTINLKNQRQPHCHFSRRYRQNEQEHNLPVGLMPPRSSDYERQPCRVEHYLERHEDEEQITAYQQACQPQRKQDPG